MPAESWERREASLGSPSRKNTIIEEDDDFDCSAVFVKEIDDERKRHLDDLQSALKHVTMVREGQHTRNPRLPSFRSVSLR